MIDSNSSVCIVSQQFGNINNKSGVGTYTNNLVDYLSRNVKKITLCTPDIPSDKISDNIKLIKVPVSKYDFSHGNWISFAYNFSKIFNRLVREESFDIVHFTDAREALFCRKTDIPFVGTQNDYYYAITPSNPFKFKKHYNDWVKRYAYYTLVKNLEIISLNKLDKIITSSKYSKTIINKIYSIPLSKIDTVYNGINQVTDKYFDKKANSVSFPVLLFVGANYQRKGLPLLLKALSLLIDKFPKLKLNVIGENQNKNKMITLCNSLGLNNNVDFHGFMPNDKTLEYFSKSHIFILPSIIEAFGIVFLEAMRAGVPVIAGNTGGIPEVIINNMNGFLVNPADHIELAGKIEQLLTDYDLREKFIQEGYNTLKKFTIENMVRDTINAYNKVVLA